MLDGLVEIETVEETAQRLRLSPGRVRTLLREGRLRGVKVPHLKDQWFIYRDSAPQGDPFEDYMTVPEAAKRFNCGERRVRSWRAVAFSLLKSWVTVG